MYSTDENTLRTTAPMVAIDVTVVTYNSRELLVGLLDGLFAQTVDHAAIHLYVVDNASTDGTVERLRELLAHSDQRFGTVTIEESGENLGFGRGHNLAAAGGSSPYLFFLNPDVVLPPDCLRRLLAEAEASEKSVAIWEPRQLPYEHPKIYDTQTLDTPWVVGAAFLCRREAFAHVGGFDQRIFLYSEDVDLSFRLRAGGYTLRYVPHISVHHFTFSEPDEVKPIQFLHSSLGNLYLRARFGSTRDVLNGLVCYLGLFRPQYHTLVSPRDLFRHLVLFFRNYLYFRRGGWRKKLRVAFHGWDYSARRSGVFHPVIPLERLPITPLVSVLVRTSGRSGLLRRALRSIANQVYPHVEVVIVEDGPGAMEDVLRDEFPHLSIQYHALGEHHGRSAAGNEAMRRATGEFFTFLDEGEEMYADHIEQLVAEALRSQRKVAVSTAFAVPTRLDASGECIVAEGEYQVAAEHPFSQIALAHHNDLPINTVLFHRSLFDEFGGFDIELDNQEDWNLWVRYCSGYGKFAYIPKTTALYRVPMDRSLAVTRRQQLELCRTPASRKQANLPIMTTVGALAEEYDEMVCQFKTLPGLEGINLLAVCSILQRHPWLAIGLRLAARVLKRFVKR